MINLSPFWPTLQLCSWLLRITYLVMSSFIRKRHWNEENELEESHKRRCLEIEELQKQLDEKKRVLESKIAEEMKEMRSRQAKEIKDFTAEVVADEDTVCVACENHAEKFVPFKLVSLC